MNWPSLICRNNWNLSRWCDKNKRRPYFGWNTMFHAHSSRCGGEAATKENHVRDWWSEEKSFDSNDSVQRPLGIATEKERLPGRPAIKEYRSLLAREIKGGLRSHRSFGCHSQGMVTMATGHHLHAFLFLWQQEGDRGQHFLSRVDAALPWVT